MEAIILAASALVGVIYRLGVGAGEAGALQEVVGDLDNRLIATSYRPPPERGG